MKTSLKILPLVGALACWLGAAEPAPGQPQFGPAAKDPAPAAARPATPRASDNTANPSPNANTMYQLPPADEALRFTNLDKDNDGRISRAEFTLASPQLQIGGKVLSAAGNQPDPRANASGIGVSANNSVELFKLIDTDNDGFLSHAELDAQHRGTVDVTK